MFERIFTSFLPPCGARNGRNCLDRGWAEAQTSQTCLARPGVWKVRMGFHKWEIPQMVKTRENHGKSHLEMDALGDSPYFRTRPDVLFIVHGPSFCHRTFAGETRRAMLWDQFPVLLMLRDVVYCWLYLPCYPHDSGLNTIEYIISPNVRIDIHTHCMIYIYILI